MPWPDTSRRRHERNAVSTGTGPARTGTNGRQVQGWEDHMPAFTRRTLLAGATALRALSGVAAQAQDTPVLRFSAVFSEQDIRAEMTKMFAEDIAEEFKLEPYYGGT